MKQRLHWSESMSVGNPVIDKQHAELLELGNAASRLLDEDKDNTEQAHIVLNDIAEALREHHATEERLLAQNICPFLEQHVAEHAAYHERIALILKRAALDHDLDKVALLTLIREVTTTHVLGMDALSKDYLI